MSYTAPVEEMAFALEEVAGLAEARAVGAVGEVSPEDVRAILAEAGRFAEERLAPLDAVGDRTGARLENGEVVTPPGWKEAWAEWIEGGWSSLTGDPEFGGQGLPMALQIALTETWNQANAAFALNPLLSVGAVEALQLHATDDLKALYLPKLNAGTWTGTMNLTEPHAGSDLSQLRTRAEPEGDRYRLFGQKIYITYGEHDLADNIVHMVLARLPGAPEGTRGISLFLVPKFLPGPDGQPGERNDVACVGLERKLGMHASPTCTMAFGADGRGAAGWLVGEPHQGLKAMFTMMNNARVQVGVQGVAVAERATQRALAYARERRQGRAASYDGEGMAPILHHADVARMLATMRSATDAARAVCYACAVAIDRGREGRPDAAFWKGRADLLTPVAKAFATDVGVEVASIGIQVHGGMGFIEETGAAQHYRDARIFPIYEGTNGIQAVDLVRRKIGLGDGEVLAAYLGELRQIAAESRGANHLRLAPAAERLEAALAAVEEAAAALRRALADDGADRALAAASPFLRALGTTAGGAYLCRSALRSSDGLATSRAALARHFAHGFLSGVPPLAEGAIAGADDVLEAGASMAAA